MKRIRLVVALLGISFFTNSCSLLFEDYVAANTPLSGKIDNDNFEYDVGYVTVSDNDGYTVYIWGDEGANIAIKENNNYKIFPYVQFPLSSIDTAQSYTVNTFGLSSAGNPGKMITAWTSLTTGIWFDSGELKIEPIGNNRIKVIFVNCNTKDKSNSLNGYCEIPLW